MTLRWLIAIAALAAATGGAGAADEPTAKDAEAFIARVEAELIPLNEYSARVSWIGNNFITEDTMWLQAKVRAEMTRLRVDNAKEAATFDRVEVDPAIRRKLDILKRQITLPAPRGRIPFPN